MSAHPLAAALLLTAAATAADPPAPAVLHLADAGRLPGGLVASDDPGVWRWRSPAFARPLDFPLAAVRGVEYAVPPAAPRPAGEYSVELAGGDVVYGDLAALTDDVVELAGTAAGRLRLRRDQVRRFSRWNGNGTVYVGPTGLTGWTRADGHWREDGGHLVTDKPGADLWADLGVPDKALIEVGLSWVGKPDFTLAVGVDDKPATARRAFRFEVWDGELVAVGESAKDADLAVVQPAPAGGQARVRVLLDQVARRLTVLGPTGKAVSTLAIGVDKPATFGGVRLVNGKGDVRLEHLRVARWDGRPPPEVEENRPWLGRTDGSVVYGKVTAYDPAAKRFTVRDGETETAVPHDAVADVYAAPPATSPEPAARPARVVLRDGTRVSGRPTGTTDTHLTLDCPGVSEPIRLPLAAVRSVVMVRPTAKAPQVASGRGGRLEADGLSLPGRLEGGDVPAGGLLWRPELGQTAAPLAAGFAGRIVYRDPAPPPPAPPVAANAPGRVVVQRFDGPVVPPAAPVVRLPASGRKSLHLRTGDALPCEVSRIDERGVTLTSPQSDITFVPHDKIKSVELVAAREAPGLDEAKRDRLLTLPRSQKDSPPTHLVCSTTGDFLRGRVVEMDDTHLKVEVRLETKAVPRDRVAQVVWLHPDELAADPPAPPAAGQAGMRAQAVHRDGSRLTFAVTGSDGNTLSGTSEVLGGCRVALTDVDQVLLGGAVARSAADLAYHPWRLRPAAEPKAASAGDGDGGASGLDSPLVGKPAPAFELKLLDGTPYQLAGRKGRVVVLDFWASWCGPCVQSMPLVDEVVREFADRGVELLAVNLEEPPERARGLLDRLKLTVPVALDRDGAVAAKYGVTSIPQAVVIGRDGKVARLYVGGGKATAEALRAALGELTAKPAE